MQTIYLDHNATTPLLPEVWEAMRPPMSEAFGNPSSAHAVGRKARQALEDARERIAALLGAFPDEVTFTSGATEANNIAVFGLVRPTPPTPLPLGRGEKAEEPTPNPSLKGGEQEPSPSPLAGAGGESSSRVRGDPMYSRYVTPDTTSRRAPSPVGEAPPPAPARGEGQTNFSFHSVTGAGSCIASHLEHPCVVEPLRQLEARGVPVEWLPVDARGVLSSGLLPPTAGTLVCVMLANHETGAMQPVREIARSLPPGAKLHCDAVQAVGKVPVDFSALGATTLSASAHKFGGPKGVGVLVTKRGTDLTPLTFGGHQQRGRRPGTEPVALAVGMAVALESAVRNLSKNRAKLETLRSRFWYGLERLCGLVVLNGPEIGAADVVPTTLNVSFPGCRADLLLMALDLAGVACSTGSACSSGSLLPSPVLRAMGVPEDVFRAALRFSFSPRQSVDEIDTALNRIAECVNRLRSG